MESLKRKLHQFMSNKALPPLNSANPPAPITASKLGPGGVFTVHKTTRKIGLSVCKMIKETIPDAKGVKLFGLQEDDEGLILVGDYLNYRRILHEANKLLAGPELMEEVFSFTSMAIMTGSCLEAMPLTKPRG